MNWNTTTFQSKVDAIWHDVTDASQEWFPETETIYLLLCNLVREGNSYIFNLMQVKWITVNHEDLRWMLEISIRNICSASTTSNYTSKSEDVTGDSAQTQNRFAENLKM